MCCECAAFLKLSFQYWNATRDASCLGAKESGWEKAVRIVLDVVSSQQVALSLYSAPYLYICMIV